MAKGIDPKQHEKKQREEALIKSRSGGVFVNHIFSLLENKQIDGKINSDLILLLMDGMTKKKLRTQQKNLLSLIEQVFNYAILTKRTRISPLDTATKLELKKNCLSI